MRGGRRPGSASAGKGRSGKYGPPPRRSVSKVVPLAGEADLSGKAAEVDSRRGNRAGRGAGHPRRSEGEDGRLRDGQAVWYGGSEGIAGSPGAKHAVLSFRDQGEDLFEAL